jgi:2-methylisocitrate lyase-like PEP mutase family enzyme
MSASPAERAEVLRGLHTAPELLVLPNVWDAASARTAAAVPGVRAIGTASWSIAAAHGLHDGEAIGRDAMLAAVARIAAAVDLPVSADLERGFGAQPRDVAETVARAIAAGAVGVNLEDAVDDATLRPVAAQVRRLEVARGRAQAEGVPVVLNARTDVLLLEPPGDPEEALARARAYAQAGADCVFVPGLHDRDLIARLVAEAGAPVSLLVTPASPSLDELAALGVARVSFGPGTMGVALQALRDAVAALVDHGPLPGALSFRPGDRAH